MPRGVYKRPTKTARLKKAAEIVARARKGKQSHAAPAALADSTRRQMGLPVPANTPFDEPRKPPVRALPHTSTRKLVFDVRINAAVTLDVAQNDSMTEAEIYRDVMIALASRTDREGVRITLMAVR
jgi:hypothetical protein